MLNTPVLFLVFNRPETTRQVFEAIRKAQPRQLFVAADGPRADTPGEKEKCEEVRRIATAVDWDCEVKTLFREKNLGCGRGPATAITWFFENVEQGIILEDDCLPDPTFFSFCEILLDYYKANDRVMHISGNNFQFGKKYGKASYYFSKYSHNWGWATWYRAWKHYRFKLNDLDKYWDSILDNYYLSDDEKRYWRKIFEELRQGRNDIWDGQWLYTVWKNKGLAILPNENLIQNIGFGENATHTFQTNSILANMKVNPLRNIIHPEKLEINVLADKISFNKIFLFTNKEGILKRIKSKIFKIKNRG